jgi:hypothetical protein
MSVFPFRNRRKGRPLMQGVERMPSGAIREASRPDRIKTTGAAVYVMEVQGVVKIGYSTRPTQRAQALRKETRREISIAWVTWGQPGDMKKLEAAVHTKLKAGPLHLTGEWYTATALLAARIIRDTAKEIGISLDVSGIADEEPCEDDGVLGYGTHGYDWARVLIDEVGKS